MTLAGAIGCGNQTAPDVPDAALVDAALPDAPSADAALPDTSVPDASPDATVDATPPDGGPDDPCSTSFATSDIVLGDVHVVSPLDVQVLAGKRAITGSLTINLADVSLPDLQYVGGNLLTTGATTNLSLPRLCHVLGSMTIDGQMQSVTLETLHDVGTGISAITSYTLTALSMPELTTIGGPFWIQSPLATLSAPQLTSIGGELYVWKTSGPSLLPDFKGLASLETVSSIRLVSMSKLFDLSGLEHVTSLPNGLSITQCPNIRSLRGLGLTDTAIGGIEIVQDNAISDISALSPIRSLVRRLNSNGVNPSSGGIDIEQDTSLTDVSGLAGVQTVAGSISIQNMPHLTAIDWSLQQATAVYIGPGSNLQQNAALTSVRLPNLTTLSDGNTPGTGGFTISNNANLTQIDLHSLTRIDGNAHITDNPKLPTCQAAAVQAQVTLPPGDTFDISGNGTGTCP